MRINLAGVLMRGLSTNGAEQSGLMCTRHVFRCTISFNFNSSLTDIHSHLQCKFRHQVSAPKRNDNCSSMTSRQQSSTSIIIFSNINTPNLMYRRSRLANVSAGKGSFCSRNWSLSNPLAGSTSMSRRAWLCNVTESSSSSDLGGMSMKFTRARSSTSK